MNNDERMRRHELCKIHTQSYVDSLKSIMNWNIVMNGAAATALLATSNQKFHVIVIFFGIGVVVAISNWILLYYLQMLYAESLNSDDGTVEADCFPISKFYKISPHAIKRFFILRIILLWSPIGIFIGGLYCVLSSV